MAKGTEGALPSAVNQLDKRTKILCGSLGFFTAMMLLGAFLVHKRMKLIAVTKGETTVPKVTVPAVNGTAAPGRIPPSPAVSGLEPRRNERHGTAVGHLKALERSTRSPDENIAYDELSVKPVRSARIKRMDLVEQANAHFKTGKVEYEKWVKHNTEKPNEALAKAGAQFGKAVDLYQQAADEELDEGLKRMLTERATYVNRLLYKCHKFTILNKEDFSGKK